MLSDFLSVWSQVKFEDFSFIFFGKLYIVNYF